MKVRELSAIAALLGMCAFAKMERPVKVKAFKAYRAIKEGAAVYDDAVKEASEKFKPEGFDEMLRKVQGGATVDEAKAFNEMSRKYNEDVDNATKALGDAVIEPKFEQLSEDEFFALVDSNEKLTAEQISRLENALCKHETKEIQKE
ncbi:MAG: hypothetical protein K2M11_08560 [Paramuribaculum sp.]|nr:hypothetical protein [Paramuribaculum sp.]